MRSGRPRWLKLPAGEGASRLSASTPCVRCPQLRARCSGCLSCIPHLSPIRPVPAPARRRDRGCCRWAPLGRRVSERPRGPRQLWLFGDLPLGSRSADPHSTAVWCGSLLHSSPQPHTAGFFHSSPDGVLATATKICARRRSSRGRPPLARRSPMSFLHDDALSIAAAAAAGCETNSASLTWAPSIFGAAHFGR